MELPIIPMSYEDFDVMERPFGWKVEYWEGHAHLTPRGMGVKTKINLVPRQFSPTHPIVPVTPDDRDRILAGYFEAFSPSVEFCGWPTEDIQNCAEKDIGKYFAGTRGQPLSASAIALAPDSQTLIGLLLVSQRSPEDAFMDLLYVRPEFQRQGVATAMLHWVIDRLIALGFQTLASRYHVCNDGSRRWHHGHGFEDEYDRYYIQMKIGWCRSEIWRREKLGLINEVEAMKQEWNRWKTMVPTDFDEVW
jgi:GNAT superfamily N-acetyltransferase